MISNLTTNLHFNISRLILQANDTKEKVKQEKTFIVTETGITNVMSALKKRIDLTRENPTLRLE